MRAKFDWKLHGILTLATLGVWGICLISALIKRSIWPWACEHCGWHEPDFRSPEERMRGLKKPRPRSGESGSWIRTKDGRLIQRSDSPDAEPTEEPPKNG